MTLETNNSFNLENIGTELHLMGKLNFIKDPLSNKRLPLLECWNDNKYIVYCIEEGQFSYDITSMFFEESKETTFIIECSAILHENNVLHDVKCSEIFKSYKTKE